MDVDKLIRYILANKCIQDILTSKYSQGILAKIDLNMHFRAIRENSISYLIGFVIGIAMVCVSVSAMFKKLLTL